ncbi:MAG: amino acid ABC transporter substrate-binding protein [Chloroflexi bacterium]|nr:amino acid ABC transporter substrate-binding protein [Chloroflexota bacterium]
MSAKPAASAAAKPAASAPAAANLGLAQAGQITAATQDVQRPFTMVTDSGQRDGFAINTVDEIAKRLGLKTTYTAISLTTLLTGVGTGQYDIGAIGLQVTDDRKQTVEFSEPYYWGYAGLVVRKADPVKSLDDLKGKQAAAIRGTVQETALQKLPGVTVKSFDSQSPAVASLRGGQVDAFLVGGADAEDYTKQYTDLTITQEIASDNPTAMPIAKGKAALVKAVNDQLDAMFKDGTYMALYNKWFTTAPIKQFTDLHPELVAK